MWLPEIHGIPQDEADAGARAERYVQKYCREMGLPYDREDVRTLAIYLAYKQGFLDRGGLGPPEGTPPAAASRAAASEPDPKAA